MRCLQIPVVTILACLSPAVAGELQVRELVSKALEQTVKLNVLLPDSYGADASKRYPVVYLLHGYGGDFTEWQRVGVVEEAAGLDVIIAMPEGDKSFYINHHEDPKGRWEDYITKDVIEYVDASYRTVATRAGRAISGLSMGGYGAMTLGLRHPGLYGSIASHSGALLGAETTIGGVISDRLNQIFGPADSPTRTAYGVTRLVKELAPERRPHIYIDCGSSDFLLESNRKVVAELSGGKYEYEYREVPGGHDFAYWKRNVRYSLSRQLEGLSRATATLPEPPSAAAGAGSSVAGTWKMLARLGEQESDYQLKIEEKEGALKAVLISPRSGEHPFRAVAFKDGVLRMELVRDYGGTELTLTYEGKLEGGKLQGKITAEEFPGSEGEWRAEPEKADKAEKSEKSEKAGPPEKAKL